jgi:hypothetical protein
MASTIRLMDKWPDQLGRNVLEQTNGRRGVIFVVTYKTLKTNLTTLARRRRSERKRKGMKKQCFLTPRTQQCPQPAAWKNQEEPVSVCATSGHRRKRAAHVYRSLPTENLRSSAAPQVPSPVCRSWWRTTISPIS